METTATVHTANGARPECTSIGRVVNHVRGRESYTRACRADRRRQGTCQPLQNSSGKDKMVHMILSRNGESETVAVTQMASRPFRPCEIALTSIVSGTR